MVGFSYVLMLLAAIAWLYFRIVLAKPWHNFLFVILVSLIILPNLLGIDSHPVVVQVFVPLIVGTAAGDFSFRFVVWILVKINGNIGKEEIESKLYNRQANSKIKKEGKKQKQEEKEKEQKQQMEKEEERERRRQERLKQRKKPEQK